MYPGRFFLDYAVLGDDVVIADEQVAQKYAAALGELGVMISYQKSLVSHSGAAEFAKRFKTRGLTQDLSPVSARACLNAHHPYGAVAIHTKYGCRRFSTICRLTGVGFRVLSRITHTRSLKIERLWVLYTKGNLPLDLWLGHGLPLDPYVKGVLTTLLCKEFRPKQLVLPPEEVQLGLGAT